VTPLGHYIVQTLVTLAGVVALAVLVLYAARRVGIGKTSTALELVGRLPLDPRRAVYLVRVGSTIYVLGASEHAISKLGELPREELLEEAASDQPSFREVFARVLRGRNQKGGKDQHS
jgi:flagellar biogenesis protein FliO